MKMFKKKIYKLYNKFIKHYREITEITYDEVMEIIKNNSSTILLDVRSEQEYNESHLNNSINIPLYDLSAKAEEILKNKEGIIIVYCQSGLRSKKAIKVLKSLGYNNIYNLKGRTRCSTMSIRLL